MSRLTRTPARLALAVAGLLATLGPAAAQFDDVSGKLMKKHLPYRKHQALGEKVVGVLVYDAQPVLSQEGRSGPTDQLCFAQDGMSYRWVYVVAQGNAMIQNLQVPIGKDANGGKMIFDRLNMASPKTVAPHGIMTKYTLVEVEVNNGAGSPPEDSFVATKFRVLEGTKEFPLKVSQVLDQLKQNYTQYVKQQEQNIEAEMVKSQQAALKDQKPTGPRAKTDLIYLTWMTADNTLEVRFLSKLADGQYQFIQGGVNPPPFPLPPPPLKDPKQPPPPGAAPAQPPVPAAVPQAVPAPVPQAAPAPVPLQAAPNAPFPPPPPQFQVKIGTTFGVEYGRIYTVSKEGKITNTQNLEVTPFMNVLPPPPGVGGPFGGVQPPRPLPLPPVKK
jgi:hypothetical protein